MSFNLNYSKAEQATAVLLRLSDSKRMNFYRLLKLLYIADRESIQKTGRPIVGGRYVAMDRGPLHSTIYDLIKGCDVQSPDWMLHFRPCEQHEIEMVSDPGVGALSKRDINLLNDIFNEFKDMDEWDVGEFSHKFEEFVKNRPPEGSSRTIPFEELLAAIGRSDDAQSILQDAADDAAFDRLFSRYSQ